MQTPSTPRIDPGHSQTQPANDVRQDLAEMHDLMALVAHELRNPLHALSLQMSVARLTAESHGQADVVTRIVKAQRTLERYTDRVTILLDLVTRQGQSYPSSAKEVDLTEALGSLVESLAAEAAYFNVSMVYKPNGPCPALIDALLVEQIAENLMLNAFKHASCSVLEVKLASDEGWATLDIADNGRGIAAEDQEQIFSKFGVASQSGRGSGSGLGLWIVRRLSQVLGGQVSLTSARGQGCTFTVRFPLSQTVHQATS